MKSLADCRLYTFVDYAYLHGRTPQHVAQQLCEGGSDLIQLRAKNVPEDEIHRVAEALLSITKNAGVPLVINDYPQIAAAIGAPFCHLGQEDFFDRGHRHVRELRSVADAGAFGLSTHAPDEAERAIAAGPAYIAIGPVFATGTKPSARPVTLEYVRWAAAHVTIPWFAIGGITLKNLEEVMAAGATRVCVVSAILNAPDIALACQEFRRRLDRNVAAH
jgi:thiamine-phosphate pyrophosphorylase